MFERSREKLLPHHLFAWRLVYFAGVAVLLLLISLAIGVAGYHWIAGFDLIDSILEASMILTGMGPIGVLHGTASKLFASIYAVFGGVIFITSVGVLLAPIIHRTMHRFHLD